LAVDLPLLEKKEEDDFLKVSAVCISIEDIKLIYNLLSDNYSEVKEINPTIMKYVERIQHADESRIVTKIRTSIFEPNEELFKYIPIGFTETINKEQFKEARHYVLLQSVSTKDDEEVKVEKEKWEQCLLKILIKTNLNTYCKRIEQQRNLESHRLEELFHQIYKSPNGFLLNLKDEGKVKVMAHFLVKYLKTSKYQIVHESLQSLQKHYENLIKSDSIKYRQIKQYLQSMINSLSNKANIIEDEVKKNNCNVFYCTMAKIFISRYTCNFKIKGETPKKNNSVYQYKLEINKIDKKNPAQKLNE